MDVLKYWADYVMNPTKIDLNDLKVKRQHPLWAVLRKKEYEFVAYGINMHDAVVPYETWNLPLFLENSDKMGIIEDVAYYLIKRFFRGYLKGITADSQHVSVVLHALYNQVPAIRDFLEARGDDVSWIYSEVKNMYTSCFMNKHGTPLQMAELETLARKYLPK